MNIYQETTKPKVSAGKASRWATKYVAMRSIDDDGPMGLVAGKVLMRRLADDLKASYGVSISNSVVARSMLANEVPVELASVLGSLRSNSPLPAAYRAMWATRASLLP